MRWLRADGVCAMLRARGVQRARVGCATVRRAAVMSPLQRRATESCFTRSWRPRQRRKPGKMAAKTWLLEYLWGLPVLFLPQRDSHGQFSSVRLRPPSPGRSPEKHVIIDGYLEYDYCTAVGDGHGPTLARATRAPITAHTGEKRRSASASSAALGDPRGRCAASCPPRPASAALPAPSSPRACARRRRRTPA